MEHPAGQWGAKASREVVSDEAHQGQGVMSGPKSLLKAWGVYNYTPLKFNMDPHPFMAISDRNI